VSAPGPPPSVTYVTLDPDLRRRDPDRFARLFGGFASGYAKHFSGDQAETTSEWLARIEGTKDTQPVMRIVVAVASADSQERVVGGIAAEYYRRAASVLATYLYVVDERGYRRRGHARSLLAQARRACALIGPVRAVFSEAEWPEALESLKAPAATIAAARERLRFFARLRARLLAIDYVQPALDGSKRPVVVLRLFVLPSVAPASGDTDDQLAATAGAFLETFYAALGETGGTLDMSALETMKRQLHERRPLTMPLPRLRLEDVALSFHFVEALDGRPDGAAILKELLPYQCAVFHSMETDLLSRAYRARRLFRTVCLTTPDVPGSDAGIAVDVQFPNRLFFGSENRLEHRQWPLRRRTVRAYLASTVFFEARQIVWHLTLRSDIASSAGDGHGWLDEVDVIALLKLADDTADQEFVRVPADGSWSGPCLADEKDPERRIGEHIEFRVLEAGQPPHDVTGLLVQTAALTDARLDGEGLTPHNATSLCGVTVEVLDKKIDARQPFYGISDHLEREALCGIFNRILDFDAIDDAEARDTLTPSVPLDAALLSVHRETLVYVGHDDRAARTVAGSVGISPYLIIPHAAALCNEALLVPFDEPAPAVANAGSPSVWRRLARRGRAVWHKFAPPREGKPVTVLSEEVERLEETLRRQWVPDPFFYATERKLYKAALQARGTTARRRKVEELLLDLKTRLELAREAERARFEAVVTGLLGAISVVSVDTIVMDFVASLYGAAAPGAASQAKVVGHLLTLGLACFIGLVVYATKRPGTESQRTTADRKDEP